MARPNDGNFCNRFGGCSPELLDRLGGDLTNQHEQLDELRRSLDLLPEEIALDQVVPILVPVLLADNGEWPGPIALMRTPELAVTWACLLPAQTMLYVNFKTVQFWENNGLDWRRQSMENLARMSEQISSHSFQREGGAPYGLVMMQDDGIGPSRLLLNEWLEEVFPEGYWVAIPERSVGFVLSRTALPEEREKVERLVVECFEKGSQPLKREMFVPDLLTAMSSECH